MKHACALAFLALVCLVPAQQKPAQNDATKPAPTSQELDALRQRAFAAENDNRHGEAADAFLALSRAEPERVDWVIAAGRCLVASGRGRAAVDLLDGAQQRFSGSLEVKAMLARALLRQTETERGLLHPEVAWVDAAELAEAVLAIDADHEDSRLVLAQARYLLGDWEQAVQQAEEAVKRHPQRAGAHLLLGRIAADRFRALLRQYETEKPEGQAAADLVGRIDAERQAARAAYERAAGLDRKRPMPHIALGQLAWLDKKDDEGRAHFADALAIDPDVNLDHDAMCKGLDWQARALLYARVRERHAAGGTSRPEKVATLLFHEGRARFDGGEWQAARADFDKALAANPAATNNHWYLFLCAWRLDDHDAAEKHAVAYAAAGAPAFADVVRALGGELRGEVGAVLKFLADRAHAQKRIEASRDLNHVLACLRDSADAWNNHAFLCRETGRFDDALSSYQHALEKEPDSPQLLNDTAVILQYHLKSHEHMVKARSLYARAIKLADKQLSDARVAGDAREGAKRAKADALANLAAMDRPSGK